MTLIIHNMICRIGEHSHRAAKLHLTPTFKFTSQLFPLNKVFNNLPYSIILSLLLALTSFHCFYYPYFPSLLFIFVTSTFISQIMIHVFLPHSTIFWSTICKFCSINGWHNKKSTKNPLLFWTTKGISFLFSFLYLAVTDCAWEFL